MFCLPLMGLGMPRCSVGRGVRCWTEAFGGSVRYLREISSWFLLCLLGTTLMNEHMTGEFPVLKPGANAVSWTGTVSKVVAKPNWRYL